jgi:hypothetical protein
MMLRDLVLRTGGVLLGALLLNQSCVAQRTFQTGVVIHLGGAGNSTPVVQRSLDAAGMTFRNEVQWHGIEAAPGVLQFPSNEGLLDSLVTHEVQHQRRPILLLDYGNKFYDEGGQVSSQAGIAAYARYAEFVVNHYKSRVQLYEVWNEWIYGAGSTPVQKVTGDPVQYASLLRAAYQGIKREDSSATVLGGVPGIGTREFSWIKSVAAAGGLNDLDAFSVHPYVHCLARSRPLAPGAGGAPTTAAPGSLGIVPGTAEDAIDWLDRLHALLGSLAPGRQIPIFVTEIGWPTNSGTCGVPAAVAAAYLQRFYLAASTRPWINGVWWYDLVSDGTDPTNQEDNFGLLTANGTPKAAYGALAAVSELVGTNAVPTLTTGSGGELVVNGKTANGKNFYAAWLPTNLFNVQMDWPLGRQLLAAGMKIQGPQTLINGSAIGAVPVILVQP